MAAIGVLSIKKGWAGDIRRQRCVLNIGSATTDTLVPANVGLHKIYGIVPTGKIGSWDGVTLVATTGCTLNATGDVIIFYDLAASTPAALADGNVEVFVYGI